MIENFCALAGVQNMVVHSLVRHISPGREQKHRPKRTRKARRCGRGRACLHPSVDGEVGGSITISNHIHSLATVNQ